MRDPAALSRRPRRQVAATSPENSPRFHRTSRLRALYCREDRPARARSALRGLQQPPVTREAPRRPAGRAAWSPTGDSIAYTVGGNDNTDLYLIGTDGRGKFRLTATPDKDIDPSWVAR